jgi:hypothetical protein
MRMVCESCCVVFFFASAVMASVPSRPKKPWTIQLIAQHKSPVLTVDSPGAQGIKYGFEGGRVLKLGGTYRLFTAELAGDPRAVRMRFGYWTSRDRVHWKRMGTLLKSSGECGGKDPRAALWEPTPIYNRAEGRWDLFYVAYRCLPNTKTQWRVNYDGQIWRAVSNAKGPAGIGGPYRDADIILQPGKESQPWEGLQGTDSFFPYQAGQEWFGLYGSAKTEKRPASLKTVGLASARQLAGPWRRMPGLNPLPIHRTFAENPIVTRLTDGSYAAVYDDGIHNAVGYAWSPDGLDWTDEGAFVVQPAGKGKWAVVVRTPLGLVPEGNNKFTMFYTGLQKPSGPGQTRKEAMGFVTVKLVPQR